MNSRTLQDVIVDGATAFVVVLAMAFGLIIPKLCIDSITGGTLEQG